MLDAFLEMMAAERGAARHTLDAYRRDLADFSAYLTRRGADLAAASGDHIRAYLAELAGLGLRPSTTARRLAAIRQYFRFLYLEGRRGDDPTTHIDTPKQSRRLPKLLEEEEIEALIRAARAHEGPDALRLTALLELLYATGLRISELVGLPLSALAPDRTVLTVRGKGGKERAVPVGRHARGALAAWRDEIGADPDAAVFPGRGGAGLTPRAVQLRLHALARRQGLSKRVHPHLLRHSFASHILESSGDLRGVQELLGHADIATTQVYTHLDFQRLAAVYDASHPRARRRAEKPTREKSK